MVDPRDRTARFDDDRGDKKHSNPNRMQTPDDVDDPTTRRDGTTPTLWERAKQNYLYFITILAAVLGLTAVTLAFGIRLIPELVTNPLVLGAVGLLALVVVLFVVFTKAAYGRVLGLDWLVYVSGTAIGFYCGEFEPGGQDQTTVFKPYKGFSLFGTVTNAYEVQEIDPEAARNWKAPETDPDDPAEINLDEAPGDSIRTDYGTIVGVWTAGIEPQPTGRANLRLAPPDQVDADQFNVLASQLEKKQRKVELLHDENQALHQFIDENLDRVSQPFDDIIEQDLQRAAVIAQVGVQNPSRGHRNHDELNMTDAAAFGDSTDFSLSEFASDNGEAEEVSSGA